MRMVRYLCVGILSFGCMALSDWLCVLRGRKEAGALFPAGCLLLAIATGGMLLESDFPAWTWLRTVMLCLALGMLALLVHAVFFALNQGGSGAMPPAAGEKQPLVSTGVYALCRHPGVLWLGGVYFFLWASFGTFPWFLGFLGFTAADGLYACWQDRQVFPKSIQNYEIYQTSTPFLLPTRESIRRCWETLERK